MYIVYCNTCYWWTYRDVLEALATGSSLRRPSSEYFFRHTHARTPRTLSPIKHHAARWAPKALQPFQTPPPNTRLCLRHPDHVGHEVNCTEVDSPPPSGCTCINSYSLSETYIRHLVLTQGNSVDPLSGLSQLCFTRYKIVYCHVYQQWNSYFASSPKKKYIYIYIYIYL